jgi:hypothetical protein
MLYYIQFDKLESKTGSKILYAFKIGYNFYRYSYLTTKLTSLNYKPNTYYIWDSGDTEKEMN